MTKLLMILLLVFGIANAIAWAYNGLFISAAAAMFDFVVLGAVTIQRLRG